MTSKIGPARERIDLVDALRGFALFGIVIANIAGWAGWFLLTPSERDALAGGPESTWWYNFLETAVIEGKFYTIFSFLFGLGFALQLSRLEGRGLAGISIYRRRLLVLLAIGLLHMSLLWEGDIVTLYALLGFLLPLVRGWTDRRLLSVAALLIFLPVPGYALVHAVGINPYFGLLDFGYRLFAALGGDVAQEKSWLLREDWRSYFIWVLSGPPFRIGSMLENWRIPKVLAMMFIGAWAGRQLIAGTLLSNSDLLRRVAIIGFAVGIPANIALGWIGGIDPQENFWRGVTATTLYAIGVVPLGLAYAATFALLWPHGQRFMRVLAAPGRMALTNYLSQTVIGIIIFYGVGFGLYRGVSPWAFSGIAVAIFVVQVLWSRLWLRHFAQGPMESVWRRLTYGNRTGATSLAS